MCMKITIKLPTTMMFYEDHDANWFREDLRQIIPGVKLAAIGYSKDGCHVVVYMGRKDAPAVKALIKRVKQQIAENQ